MILGSLFGCVVFVLLFVSLFVSIFVVVLPCGDGDCCFSLI